MRVTVEDIVHISLDFSCACSRFTDDLHE